MKVLFDSGGSASMISRKILPIRVQSDHDHKTITMIWSGQFFSEEERFLNQCILGKVFWINAFFYQEPYLSWSSNNEWNNEFKFWRFLTSRLANDTKACWRTKEMHSLTGSYNYNMSTTAPLPSCLRNLWRIWWIIERTNEWRNQMPLVDNSNVDLWSWVKFIQPYYCLSAVSQPKSNSWLLGLLQSLPMSTYLVWPL